MKMAISSGIFSKFEMDFVGYFEIEFRMIPFVQNKSIPF